MNLTKVLMGVAVLLLGFNAHADKERGGGRGILCKSASGKVTSLQLLDYFEAQHAMTVHLDLGPSTSYEGKIQYVISRLKLVDPVFASYVQTEANNFLSNASFVSQAELTEISDVTSDLQPPSGCSEVQMAASKPAPMTFEKKYLIDQNFWQMADASTKAGLVLHEIIYLNDRKQGATTSDHSRYYNAVISSSEIASMSPGQYVNLLHQLGWDQGGTEFAEGGCSGRFSFIKGGSPYFADCAVIAYPNGSLEHAALVNQTTVQSPAGLLTLSATQYVSFYDNGQFAFGTLAKPAPFTVKNILFILPAGSTIFLSQGGALKEFTPSVSMTLVLNGKTTSIQAWQQVDL